MRLRNKRTANHKLGIFTQVFDKRRDEPCPPLCWWQGCGNIQVNRPSRRNPYTGSYAGEQKERPSYRVYFPNNQITRNALQQTDLYIVSFQENTLHYGALFKCQGEAVEHGTNSCWLQVLCYKEACNDCLEKNVWCNVPDSCPNGVVVEYDNSQELCEFINCQTEGTTICLPSGHYEACEVTKPLICIQPIEGAVVTTSGEWILGEGVQVKL